jgi:hypothetical protein
MKPQVIFFYERPQQLNSILETKIFIKQIQHTFGTNNVKTLNSKGFFLKHSQRHEVMSENFLTEASTIELNS